MGFKIFEELGLASILLILIASKTHGYHRGGHGSSSEEDQTGYIRSTGLFNVVTGPIEEEYDGANNYPWRHHVDFDERYPGEDLEAVETVRAPPRVPEVETVEHEQPLFEQDDLVVPDFARMFAEGPQIGPFARPGNSVDVQPWWNILGIKPSNPWWKGSNVCIKREEEEESEDKSKSTSKSSSNETSTPTEEPEFHMQFSACDDLDTRYSCITKLFGPKVTKTIKTEYECCHGYLLNKQQSICERGHYENIAKTIEEIGGNEFMRLAKSVGLDSKLERENLTVFVPSNEALASYIRTQQIETNSIEFIPGVESIRRRRSILMHRKNEPQGLNVRRRNRPTEDPGQDEYPNFVDEEMLDLEDDSDWKRNALDQHDEFHRNLVSYGHDDNNVNLQKTLLSHMIEGKLSTDDFVDEKVVYSENRDSVIRLNTWNIGSEKVKTVNCARLTSINHRCTNGIVHVVDKMFKPVTQTIAEIVSTNSDLSMLKTLLSSSGLFPMLRNKDEHLTLFAPTNAALEKIGSSLLLKMRNGDPCLKRILRHHILPLTFCSSIVYSEGQIRNINDDLLDIQRNADDKLFVNGSQIITRDIVTTNGVVHIIDAVIMSENDQPITHALEKAGLTTFVNYCERAGLRSLLDQVANVTIFAPTNAAFASMPQEVLQNVEKLREILYYHIATPETRTCKLSHQQLLSTRLENKPIRINLYSTFPLGTDAQVTAQCGRVTKSNNVACNGIIHEVDRVLLPPQLSVLETLKIQPDFSIFSRLLSESDSLQREMQTGQSTITIFAPTDAAFYALPKEDLQKILNDKQEAMDVLKKHIIKESLCCAGIAPNVWFISKSVVTLGGRHIPVFRDTSGQVMYGNSKITTCDLTASNGIIHTIDTVLTNSNKALSRGELMGTCIPETLEKLDIRALFFRL